MIKLDPYRTLPESVCAKEIYYYPISIFISYFVINLKNILAILCMKKKQITLAATILKLFIKCITNSKPRTRCLLAAHRGAGAGG